MFSSSEPECTVTEEVVAKKAVEILDTLAMRIHEGEVDVKQVTVGPDSDNLGRVATPLRLRERELCIKYRDTEAETQ